MNLAYSDLALGADGKYTLKGNECTIALKNRWCGYKATPLILM